MKLEGKPPFLGHAAVAVSVAVDDGKKRPRNWTAPGPMVRIPEEERRLTDPVEQEYRPAAGRGHGASRLATREATWRLIGSNGVMHYFLVM